MAEPDGVAAALQRAIELGEQGIQIAGYLGAERFLDAWAGTADPATGRAVDERTLFPVFSVSKAVTVTALHILADRGLLGYDDRVADHWPEYGVRGKESTTVRDALTHRSGAPQMPAEVTAERMCDWDWMVERVAALPALFPPRTRSAYHSHVYGWLIGELVRRCDPEGRPFGEFVREEICTPLGIEDLWLGVPDEALQRVAVLSSSMDVIIETDPVSIAAKPLAVPFTPATFNRRDVLQACLPGSGGVMSARGAARFFAMLANGGELDGVRLLSEDLLLSLTTPRENPEQIDAVMGGGGVIPLDLTVGGYWRSDVVAGTGPHLLCHGGVGSSIGWADLDRRLAVAICHNRMFHASEMTDAHPYAALRREIDVLAAAHPAP
ncbi:MAG: EstA family serine hydrolase [Frankiales bacterium]|nr:EstA family serine hydrolase [Frankiales bacterium]